MSAEELAAGIAEAERVADAHLGTFVVGLVDDTLGPADREKVLTHLVGCATCRSVVDGHRALRRRLLAAAPPAVPADLTERLRAIGAVPVPAAVPSRVTPTAPAVRGLRRPDGRNDRRRDARPGRTRPAGRPRSMSRRRAAASAFSVVALGVGLGMTALGGSSPRPTMPNLQLVDQHVATTSRTTVGDPYVPVQVAAQHR